MASELSLFSAIEKLSSENGYNGFIYMHTCNWSYIDNVSSPSTFGSAHAVQGQISASH